MATIPARHSPKAPITAAALRDCVIGALEDRKAHNVRTLDVRKIADFTDVMVIATGTSGRHVKSLVEAVLEDAGEAGVRPLGVEGRETAEWVLVDLGDVTVHVMQAQAREFYDLERLWTPMPKSRGVSVVQV